MNSTNNYEQYGTGRNSGTSIKWIFWIVACFVFPPILCFWAGWFIVSGAIWLLRCFFGTMFSVVSPNATEVNVSGYTNPIQSFSTNFYDPDRK